MPIESDPVIRQEDGEEDSEEEFAEIIASLDPLKLQSLALSARRGLSPDLPSNIYCTLVLPPRAGSFNLVYEASFSDGLTWAIRIPAEDHVLDPCATRCMYLDIVAQRFISSHTSIPLPRIHDYCLDGNNVIERPYILMDFLPGTNLSKLWNDKAWITPSKRQYIFDQIAAWMTELSALEFDQIGCLDVDADGNHIVVPFPDIENLVTRHNERPASEPHPVGPFDSASVYLNTLLRSRSQSDDTSTLRLMRLFASALPDESFDGPPFTLHPPDFDSQNVLVAPDGTITGLIDWDGVSTAPRQGGAAAYPKWITVDWDPYFYGWTKDNDDKEESKFDSPEDLHEYRKMYLDAIDRASAGRLTSITRNSHVWTTLHIGVTSWMAEAGVMFKLSQYVFGNHPSGWQLMVAIEDGVWYRSRQDSQAEIARVDEGIPSGDSSSEDES